MTIFFDAFVRLATTATRQAVGIYRTCFMRNSVALIICHFWWQKWREVENRTEGIPTAVLPSGIITYIEDNYGDSFIVDVERDRLYDIELDTGIDLDFTLEGKFIRIDY